jgi:type VI secretion system protein ImpE
MDAMTPVELFHEARLTEAITAQRVVVAARPADVSECLLLAELLAFTGDRDVVRRLLDSLAGAGNEVGDFVAEWKALLQADSARHAGQPPDCIPTRTSEFEFRIRGNPNSRTYCHSPDQAREYLDDADENAPWIEGYVDGRPFERWRDADEVIGPMLEVFRGDRYAWITMHQIRKLRIDEGDELRDILYRPATVWMNDGSQHEVFLPGLYVGTADHPEEGIRTGAGIDWVEVDGIMRGLGARTFLFGEEELAPGEFRQVEVRT